MNPQDDLSRRPPKAFELVPTKNRHDLAFALLKQSPEGNGQTLLKFYRQLSAMYVVHIVRGSVNKLCSHWHAVTKFAC